MGVVCISGCPSNACAGPDLDRDLDRDSPFIAGLPWDLSPAPSVRSPLKMTRRGLCLFDRRSAVVQARCKLLSSADSPASATQVTGNYV